MKAKKLSNPLKKLLQQKKTTIGSWITMAHPLIPQILAPAGFDWFAVDMEHSSIDLGDLLGMIIAIEATGKVPLVRVGENDPCLIKRVMDAGAYGVIVPNVSSVDDARRAVNAVKYPPQGQRGVGLYRAQGFGRYFEEYKRWLDQESVVIVQIEHIDALKEIDEILTVKGVDAFMIGPYDLSASMGKPGRFSDPDVVKVIDRIMASARRHNLAAGFHIVPPDPKLVKQKIKQGFSFLAYSVDSILLGEAADNAMKGLV